MSLQIWRSSLLADFCISFVFSGSPRSEDILVVLLSKAQSSNSCSASHRGWLPLPGARFIPESKRLVLRQPIILEISIMYVWRFQSWGGAGGGAAGAGAAGAGGGPRAAE